MTDLASRDTLEDQYWQSQWMIGEYEEEASALWECLQSMTRVGLEAIN